MRTIIIVAVAVVVIIYFLYLGFKPNKKIVSEVKEVEIPNSEFKKKVKEIVAEKSGVAEDKIKSFDDFKNSLGLDSIDLIEIVSEVEKTFDIEIPDADAEKFSSIKDIVEYLETLK